MAKQAQTQADRQAGESIYSVREADWRCGALVYQVLVDRFAPSRNLEPKRTLFSPPRVLRGWGETPHAGKYLPEARLYSHEVEFWGGDFDSLREHLDYIQALGVDVLYLNPIHLAYTNHKYDAFDFQQISPEFGTRADFIHLTEEIHRRGMKLVLDGVFNHIGRNAPIFKQALQDPQSEWRDWFAIGPQFEGGARVWAGAQNLPELNLENPAVRQHIYEAPDSVVRSYLRDGADGWRLDTAYELGYTYLADLTRAAHEEKPGSLVVGEIVNYPARWLQSLDAVMGFTLRQAILGLVNGLIQPEHATRMIARMVADAGMEASLRSWVLIDNHDIPRAASTLPEVKKRRLAQVLQFTLPGAPNLYYGTELGMTGGDDPENRAPMRWDLLDDANEEWIFYKKLIALRKQQRALRVGDFRTLECGRLFGFERYTERALETVLVLANPGDVDITESVMTANSDLMDATPMVDILAPEGAPPVGVILDGFLTLKVPAASVCVLVPREWPQGGYSRYKRVD